MNKVLLRVKYVGESNNHFTNGNIYDVIGIDEDEDYLLIDDFFNKITEYKSRFVILNVQ